MPRRQVVGFAINGQTIGIELEHAARLADLLSELHDKGRAGANGARVRMEAALDGEALDATLEWVAEEKDALADAIYLWIERESINGPPEAIAFDLRYALHGEREDERGEGSYLFELEREGKLIEVPWHLQREPALGAPIVIQGETWLVRHVGNAPSPEYRGIVHASWHPG